MPGTHLQLDTIIIGGGIAGLWLLNRLVNAGHNAILFEQDELGSGQTIASQGMIHGGIKYALGGALTGESESVATMPARWAACLDGKGDIDISNSNILSECFYLWSGQSLTSRLTSFFASKVMRGRVDAVAANERPAAFNHPDFKGSLYRLTDLVLDIPSLLQALYQPVKDRIFKIDWPCSRLLRDGDKMAGIQLQDGVKLEASNVVLTAGSGNEQLLTELGLERPAMQRRPLQQVLVKHDYPEPLYAHCLGNNPSPRLTISSHRRHDGKVCWYLGGDLATECAELDSGKLIDKARRELAELLPWVDLGRTEWATLKVDRAEPRQSQLVKPDKAYAEWAPGCKNLLVCWPTKLTLAPDMADQACALLGSPTKPATSLETLQCLPKPVIAMPCWETLF